MDFKHRIHKIITFGAVVLALIVFPIKSVFAGPTVTLTSDAVKFSETVGKYYWEMLIDVKDATGSKDFIIKIHEAAAATSQPQLVDTQLITITAPDLYLHESGAILLPETAYTAEVSYTDDTGAAQTTPQISITTGKKVDQSTVIVSPSGPAVNQNSSGGDESYTLLAPLGNFKVFSLKCTTDSKTGETSCPGFGDFLSVIFTIAIGLAGILAVIMLIYGGIQYMYFDSFSNKEDGKNKMMNAIWGLLLALGSYLILNTIDSRFVNFDLSIKQELIVVTETADDGSPIIINYSTEAGTCPADCVKLSPEVPAKNSSAMQAEKTLKFKLSQLTQTLASDPAIQGKWRVTEAWEPTFNHKAQCHKKGTCVDANFNGVNPTTITVKNFISKATNIGLCPVYESTNKNFIDQLKSEGVSSVNVLYYSRITAPHFSVYGGTCK